MSAARLHAVDQHCGFTDGGAALCKQQTAGDCGFVLFRWSGEVCAG